jgi:hypothetical protein
MTPDHGYDLARALAAENLELRELCEGVAKELERLAAHRIADPTALLARAVRIRARLHAS